MFYDTELESDHTIRTIHVRDYDCMRDTTVLD